MGLVEVGYAAVDDGGRILLGDRLLGLGTADATHLAAQFRPALSRRSPQLPETVDLSVLRGNQMWFIDQIESVHRLRAVSAVGIRFPVRNSANGKAALAVLDEAELARSSPPAMRCTVRSTDPPQQESLSTTTTRRGSAAGVADRVTGGHIVAISGFRRRRVDSRRITRPSGRLREHAFSEPAPRRNSTLDPHRLDRRRVQLGCRPIISSMSRAIRRLMVVRFGHTIRPSRTTLSTTITVPGLLSRIAQST